MHAAISTVAFSGIDTILAEVQVFADKAVAESRERVRAALG